MSDPLYSIRDWQKNFETSESNKRTRALAWVAVPTKHDGKSFRRVMRSDPSGSMIGIWCLIVQIAAKCPVRGILADHDGPLTPLDISDKTGVSVEAVERALKLFTSPEIGWVEDSHQEKASPSTNKTNSTYTTDTQILCHAATPAASAATPADLRNPIDVIGLIKSAAVPAEQTATPASDAATPAASAVFSPRPTNGGTYLASYDEQFLELWEIVPPEMRCGIEGVWLLYQEIRFDIAEKTGLGILLAGIGLKERLRAYLASARAKSKKWRWSIETFFAKRHDLDDDASWQKLDDEPAVKKPRVLPLDKQKRFA